MNKYLRRDRGNLYPAGFQSAITAIGTPVTLTDLDTEHPHGFCGVELFTDSGGVTAASASTGTLNVTVQTAVSPQVLELAKGGAIDAAALTQATWAGPTEGVTVTPTGMGGDATHYRVNVVFYAPSR